MPKLRSALNSVVARSEQDVTWPQSPLVASHHRASDRSAIAVARAVRDGVRAVPGVHDISPGRFAEVGTYGPGTVVRGVTVSGPDTSTVIGVHIVAEYRSGQSLLVLADTVRRAVNEVIAGARLVQRIDVAVDDLLYEERRHQ